MEILVAEDDFVAREFLAKMLKTVGHDVILAEDGQQAWELFKKNKPKMVITDWVMPNMNGLTLCRNIRNHSCSYYVYIILLSEKDNKSDSIEGLKAGADDYIIKPFNPKELEARIRSGQRIVQLEDGFHKAQAQLIQSEKMASVGQLAAGVAHEINNPTGFISSNLRTLTDYQNDITKLIEEYRRLADYLDQTGINGTMPGVLQELLRGLESLEKDMDIEFLLEDITDLIKDCREGTDRIKKIVIDLKDFTHPGEDKPRQADINHGIESTLNVVWNELKYKAKVVKDLGDIPLINCYPEQLNQVFMNLLVNAGQSIEETGEVTISTRTAGDQIEIRFTDTGCGIEKENLSKIFDPFFTTKEVGKGTGLGLNMAYNIIKNHNGSISVESTVGKGTTFTIKIPTT